jgi:beta-phosphoglucomutase family hydrolase
VTEAATYKAPGPAGARYAAVIFDMNGVVTDTAEAHARAWQALFDQTLPVVAAGRTVRPFDIDGDYRRYVDGRAREDGVREFLASRGLVVPDGSPTDPAGALTVSGLAARKQQLFLEQFAARGVAAFPSTVALLHRLRAEHVATGLVTASRNAAEVLDAAGVADLFDTVVDGVVADELGLAGKPDPAMFAEAARQLGVPAGQAVVVEDAEAGVRAAVAGGFGLVVGVDRTGGRAGLRAAGADLVVTDLTGLDLTIPVADAAGWGGGADLDAGPWLLIYDGFDPAAQGMRETLCTLANGYWGTRGAAPEAVADGAHYPGTYVNGVYNRLDTTLDGTIVEDESMVNAPNWLPLTFRHPDGDWVRLDGAGVLDHRQELDLRRGLLTRTVVYRDPHGRRTRITSRRLVSQAARHLAASQTTFEALDWSGPWQVQSLVDGQVANRGVAEYRALADRHLRPVTAAAVDEQTVLLQVVTSQSGIGIAVAARLRVFVDGQPSTVVRRPAHVGPGQVGQECDLRLRVGVPVAVEKVVAVATSRDRALSRPDLAALGHLEQAGDFAELLAAHERAWTRLWDDFAVTVAASDRIALALNLHTFHVLQTVAGAGADLDAGIPARGLHGEGYRGHVFWDEMFVYPMLTLRRPELTRALLAYRYRRLDAARAAARTVGLDGALFPWQSGSDGREETPTRLYNPRSDQWLADHSRQQRHVGLAIGYSVVQYHQATGDIGFLADTGAELLVEIVRCFAAMAVRDPADDRYDITGVMGPDEFHDGYPGRSGTGVRNNAYTNILTAWLLRRTSSLLDVLDGHDCGRLRDRLGVDPSETARWDHISRRLRVPFHADGVISQFDGYEKLAEFDWDAYRGRYGNIGRLDLILAAEGDSPNNYRLSKQADVLMLFYLLSAEEVRDTLRRMGYQLDAQAVRATVDFYAARTSHGSTLSRLVHSWVAARADRHRAWSLFTDALAADLADTQGGTTREGVHLGAMAGTVDVVLRCFSGLETRDDVLWLHPFLPPELTRAEFQIQYRGQQVQVELTPQRVRLRLRVCAVAPITVCVEGNRATLRPGDRYEVPLGGR